MLLKWSWRKRRWFYGCGDFPDCFHAFDADQITGEPRPGPRNTNTGKQHTIWDVLLEEDEAMKYAVGAVLDQTFGYWNGEDSWTTDHVKARLYDSRYEAEQVLNRLNGDFIDEVSNEAEFKAREPTW